MPAMPFVPAPNTIQVRVQGSYYGDTVINDFFVKKVLAPMDDADIDLILNDIDAQWSTAVLPLLNVNYVYESIEAIDIAVPLGRKLTIAAATGPGGITGDGEPGNVTARAFFTGAYRWRGGKYGVAISGLPKAVTAGNTINSTFVSNLRTALASIGGAVVHGGVYFHATVSKVYNKAPRAEAFVAPVLVYTVSSKTHTMGKRVNGK